HVLGLSSFSLAVSTPLLLPCYLTLPDLHSFPTRRSSDLSIPAKRSPWACIGLWQSLECLKKVLPASKGIDAVMPEWPKLGEEGAYNINAAGERRKARPN